MRFLVDENLSPLLAQLLHQAGHQAAHVRDLGMASAEDLAVLAHARAENRILVSADTDFGGLLAVSGDTLPSVILVRTSRGRDAATQADLILGHLPDLREHLEAGSIVAFDEGRVRLRRLPI